MRRVESVYQPQRFRKKPVEIEAIQWNGGFTSSHDAPALSASKIIDWVLVNGGTARFSCTHPQRGCAGGPEGHTIAIDTLEGTMQASPGDWIIRGVQSEFYPCKAEIFEQTHELAENRISVATTPIIGMEVLVIESTGAVAVIAPQGKANAVAAAVSRALREAQS